MRLVFLFLALLAFGLATHAEAKTLRMAYDADPTSLDPHEQLSGATLQLSHLLFDPLVRFRKDLTLEPRLAKKWEQIDERTTRFHLRPGVKFHSGRTLTAEDVVWTVESAEAEPGLQGAVRAVRRRPRGRRAHRRPRDQKALSAGPRACDLHLPHGPRILCRRGRARPAEGPDRQARRVLRLDACRGHRTVRRGGAGAGRAA